MNFYWATRPRCYTDWGILLNGVRTANAGSHQRCDQMCATFSTSSHRIHIKLETVPACEQPEVSRYSASKELGLQGLNTEPSALITDWRGSLFLISSRCCLSRCCMHSAFWDTCFWPFPSSKSYCASSASLPPHPLPPRRRINGVINTQGHGGVELHVMPQKLWLVDKSRGLESIH